MNDYKWKISSSAMPSRPTVAPQIPPVNLPPTPIIPGILPAGLDTAEEDLEWYVQMESGVQGPMQLEKLESLIKAGQIGADTFVWQPGMDQWCTIANMGKFGRMQNLPSISKNKLSRTIREIKWNCIFLFVVFIIFVISLPILFYFFAGNTEKITLPITIAIIGEMILVTRGGILALPLLRDKSDIIKRLPSEYRIPGLIGSIGLIVVTLLIICLSLIIRFFPSITK